MAVKNPKLAQLVKRLKKEISDIETKADNGQVVAGTDEYQFDIRVAPGKKPKVTSFGPFTVVTVSCPTGCGTCMKDSCYTC